MGSKTAQHSLDLNQQLDEPKNINLLRKCASLFDKLAFVF